MKTINQIYVNGAFVTPHGTELFDIINPVDNSLTGTVRLADEYDTRTAIAAAKRAFKSYSQTTTAQRLVYLRSYRDAVARRIDDIVEAMLLEYGGTIQFCRQAAHSCLAFIDTNIALLENFEFERRLGNSDVILEPVLILLLNNKLELHPLNYKGILIYVEQQFSPS